MDPRYPWAQPNDCKWLERVWHPAREISYLCHGSIDGKPPCVMLPIGFRLKHYANDTPEYNRVDRREERCRCWIGRLADALHDGSYDADVAHAKAMESTIRDGASMAWCLDREMTATEKLKERVRVLRETVDNCNECTAELDFAIRHEADGYEGGQ